MRGASLANRILHRLECLVQRYDHAPNPNRGFHGQEEDTNTKSSAATKSRKPASGKTSSGAASNGKGAKKPAKQHEHHVEPEEEIELDEAESQAIDHIVECDEAREALEVEVNKVVTQAVRKICKAHGESLSVAQAQNVAMVLFGD